jgi:hypothetical protein
MELFRHTDSFNRLFSTQETFEANSVEEVERFGGQKLDYEGSPGTNPGYIFRGELDYDIPLQSSLERYVLSSEPRAGPVNGMELKSVEFRLVHEFVSGKGAHTAFVADESINGVQVHKTDTFRWLSLMQHYGASTRLIDFSLDVRVALFFATWHHSKATESRPALASRGMVIYGFPCFGFDDIIQNKTPIVHSPRGTINMNTALGHQIGLPWTLGQNLCENRPVPLRRFGWDRPFFRNERIRRQNGMFIYPYDYPSTSLRDSRDSWLVSNMCADGPNDPFRFGGLEKRLPGITIRLPSKAAGRIAENLANSHSLTEETLLPDAEIEARTK